MAAKFAANTRASSGSHDEARNASVPRGRGRRHCCQRKESANLGPDLTATEHNRDARQMGLSSVLKGHHASRTHRASWAKPDRWGTRPDVILSHMVADKLQRRRSRARYPAWAAKSPSACCRRPHGMDCAVACPLAPAGLPGRNCSPFSTGCNSSSAAAGHRAPGRIESCVFDNDLGN